VSTPLFPPPPTHLLPFSWRSDLVVDFENVDPDSPDPENPTPLDYEDGVTGYLDLRTNPVQRFPAVITGAHAVVRIESEIADTIGDNKQWVFLLSYPGTPTTEVAVANGTTKRYDGKPVT